MVPTEILLGYMVLVVFAIAVVLICLASERQPQVNITIICGDKGEIIREGVMNGSGLLFRSKNGDMINLGFELPAGLRLNLVRA